MNVKKLAENLGVEEDEFIELAELFVQSSGDDLQALGAAIEAENVDDVVASAHSIKGAAGSLGFNDIYESARSIEEKARNQELSGASDTLQTLKGQLDQVARSLSSL